MNIFNNLKNKIIFRFLFFSLSVIRRRYSLPTIAKAMTIGVAFSNKVMDSPELPQPIKRHVAPKYDISSWYWKRMFSTFCMFFKYPSPNTKVSTSPSGGEVLKSVFNATTLNVILRRERSELSGESRNIKSIFLNRMYHPRSSANELSLKAKDDNKSVLQLGRSMIEMLGVLAIIAVLSIGGIAGYSKAMEKFKLNKAMSEYNELIFGIIEHIDDFRIPGTNYGYILQQLDLIPKSWKISSWYIDSFGNWISIHSLPQQTNVRFDIWLSGVNHTDEYRFSQGFNHKFCISFIEQLVYSLHGSLKNFSFLRTIGADNGSSVSFAGDVFCTQNKKCINQLTINDINSLCQTCDNTKQACAIVLDF